ncbi:MAG: flagellar hook-basal body complex protein [Methylococcaceae bacterium]
MGFSTALSGLKAASTTLSVTGNNISNSQTAGFKESRAQFGDVYVSSLGSVGKAAVGTGVKVSSVAQQFTQGNIEPTGNSLDLALSGEGFFAMGDLVDPIIPDKPLEATSFTRNGAFHLNNKGNVVDDSGRYLLAFKPTGTTVAEGFDVGVKLPLKVNTDQGAPTATTDIGMNVNLNGSAKAAVTPFSFTTPGTAPYIPDPKTYTHTTSITTYDALGNAHIASTYFCKTEVPNEWNAYTFIDGRSLQPGVQEDVYATPPVPASGAVALPEGTITSTPSKILFDDKGNLLKVSSVSSNGDTARSAAALAKLKYDVATAKVATNLTVVTQSQDNVTNAATQLKAAVDQAVATRERALIDAKAVVPAIDATIQQTEYDDAVIAQSAVDALFAVDNGFTPSKMTSAFYQYPEPITTLSSADITIVDGTKYDSAALKTAIDAAVITLGTTAVNQARDSLNSANIALDAASKTTIAAVDNAENLKVKYGSTVADVTTAELQEAADIAAASAAGKPIISTPITKIDFGTIDISAINSGLKVANMTFSIDLANSTQFSTPFTVNDLKQDGLPVGNLTGVDVDKHGVVFAKYSNGYSKPLGQVALARFPSNQDLAKVGATTWLATSDSGNPIYGAGGDNNFGTIQSSAIENSNVDLSAQLVKLIVAQQAYQANSQTITTEKSLVDTILRI